MEQSPTSTHKEIPFIFTGKTGEFFGIWIVNVLLIIITLGIYTAWAKVRTNRYFYGHTLLDNSPFDYLANPISILIGWIIGVAVFATYSITINFFPLIGLLVGLVVFLFIPWFVVRSMAFRLKNTAHRNIRFAFNKNYGDAALVFIGLPLLIVFTFGLIVPYMIYRQKNFIVDNSHYGQTPFQFNAAAWDFYKLALITFGVILLFIVGIAILGGVIGGISSAMGDKDPAMIQAMIMIPSFLIYFVIFAFWNTKVTNLIWNNVQLDQHHFRCTLKVGYMLWLYFSNTIAILVSLGLLIPWARIRTTRYRLENLAFVPGDNLSAFLAAKQQEESAIGEQVGEIMDIDIGL